jgi:3-methyladenine DNA glycosylase AlkD
VQVVESLDYVAELKNLFRNHANPANALPMQKYMRYQFPFLGIKTPERQALLRQFLKEHPLDEAQVAEVARGLWLLPEREFHYVAMDLLLKLKKRGWYQDDLGLLEELIIQKSWWDTVDVLAPRMVGPYVQQYPQEGRQALDRWIESDNKWLRRSSLIHQLRFKEKTDEKLLYDYILKCRDSKEFFIQKAIGWALREYAKTNPESVLRFVELTDLPALSRREALKHLEQRKE